MQIRVRNPLAERPRNQDGEKILHTDRKVAAQIPARIPHLVDRDISNGPALYFFILAGGPSPFESSGSRSSSSLGLILVNDFWDERLQHVRSDSRSGNNVQVVRAVVKVSCVRRDGRRSSRTSRNSLRAPDVGPL